MSNPGTCFECFVLVEAWSLIRTATGMTSSERAGDRRFWMCYFSHDFPPPPPPPPPAIASHPPLSQRLSSRFVPSPNVSHPLVSPATNSCPLSSPPLPSSPDLPLGDQRTSISVNIKERLDFSCAVFDSSGGLVANAPHLPVHLGAMQEAVK